MGEVREEMSASEAEPLSTRKDLEQLHSGATFGGARVGDLIQWESGGALQFERPARVRLVSADGQYVAVDGSETGIPMNEVVVEQVTPHEQSQPPSFPFGFADIKTSETSLVTGELEWMRNRLGGGTSVRLMITGEMGPKQISKLIKLLEAQRAVLEDDEDGDLIG